MVRHFQPLPPLDPLPRTQRVCCESGLGFQGGVIMCTVGRCVIQIMKVNDESINIGE